MKAPSDLLSRIQRWDLDALAEAYDLYAPALYRYAWRQLGNVEQAEDIVSETFQRLLSALRAGQGPQENLQAWLYRVAHNLITDTYRRQATAPTAELDDDAPVAGPEDSAELALQHVEAERVRRALWQLTPLQRQVIILRFLEGWDLATVAQTIGREVNAVKALQHRAVATLRSLLEEA